jgi:hypothetical protein
MAKHSDYPKGKTTHRDPQPAPKADWKRDRWEQRNAKTIARRNVTGGF